MPRAYAGRGASSKSVKKCPNSKSLLKPYKNNGFWQEQRVKKCPNTTVSTKPWKSIRKTTFPALQPSVRWPWDPFARPWKPPRNMGNHWF